MKTYFKYPRTYHLPWSLGSTNDDKFLESIEPFLDMDIVITEKMDGENTNMYSDKYHARSIDSQEHPSRHFVKSIWGRIKHQIPYGWRICGENLYAKHSIFYDDIESYFMVFSIWDENNICFSWEETVDICNLLNLKTVPVIENNIKFNVDYLKKLAYNWNINKSEGYVIRNKNKFNFNDFHNNVAKWVRNEHVNNDKHWMFKKVVPNKLK